MDLRIGMPSFSPHSAVVAGVSGYVQAGPKD